MRRYQVDSTRFQPVVEPALAAPKFLSERAREQPKAKSDSGVSEAAEALTGATINGEAEEDPLLKYSNVEIKYSKFGVDDFDFRCVYVQFPLCIFSL
jgi:PAB-dependent poly(A)-specific ribonuclease subunit 2